MKVAAAVLVPLLAAGAGVAGWVLLRPAPPAPAGTPRAKVRPVDPAVERRLDEATALLKQADGAEGAERRDRAKQAAEILDALERARPEDAELAFWRGMAAVLAGDVDAARAALERVRVRSPDRARAPAASFLQAAITMTFEPEKVESAVRTLKGLPSRAPKWRPREVAAATYKALRMWSRRSLDNRNGETALRALEEAKALVKDDPAQLFETRVQIAHVLGWNSRWPEATDAWIALDKETGGENPEVQMGLGDAYAIQNDNAHAVERFSRVLELMSRVKEMPARYAPLHEALLRRGNGLRLLGRDAEAKADLEDYVARFPDEGRGWYWLGVFRFDQLEDSAGARAAFEKARSLAPYCDQYLRRLMQTLESTVPDAPETKALKEEIATGAGDRARRRQEISKARGDLRNLCE
jgi:tetratricopeptide (TPR) repeat protein